MSTQLNIIIPKIKTSSGQLYISEEEFKDKSQKKKVSCLSMLLSDDFDKDELLEEKIKLKNQICFRQLQKMKKSDNEEFYIFEYIEGKTIDKLINESLKNSLGFTIERISSYFLQVLNALYLLHKQNILGRVFSTNNIIENNGGIVLMDFGFGPDICQPDVNIISPPEIIEGLKKKEKYLQYDLKLDSWMIGAFLYHCGKFTEIFINRFGSKNSSFVYCNENVDKYIQWLEEQKSPNVPFYTTRYPLKFCEFVEALLRFDPQYRLSFSQIYQDDYVRSLKIENREEKIKFYQQLENPQSNEYQQLKYKIMQREKKIISGIVATEDLKDEGNYKQFVFTPTDGCSSNINQIYQKFIYQIDDEKQSKQKMIWLYINNEQFKFFLLNYTANQVVKVLSQQNYQIEYLVSYILQKMSLSILNELIFKLNQQKQPWNKITEIDWKYFLNNEKQQLEQNLRKRHSEIREQLEQLFKNHCIKYIEDVRLELQIRSALKFDQTSNFNYRQSVQDFLYQGYRQVTTNLINFLKRTILIQVDMSIKQESQIILLLSVICHMINRILDLDNINTQFKNIKLQNQIDYISPNEIFSFITSQNNYEVKNNEVEYILEKYF